MIKAVIFDFDGLVLDTETVWYDAYKKVLKEAYEFDLSITEFVKCVGSSNEVLAEYLRSEIGTRLEMDWVRQETGVLHAEEMKQAVACEGVEAYLADAHAAGLKIALATSSTTEWVTKHLKHLNLLTYFDHLITRDDVEHVKPAPDLFLKAIDTLVIEPSEAVVFEDSLNGLIAARAAGIPTVIVPNPVTESLPFNDYHLKLNSMADRTLQEIIQSLAVSK